MRRALLLAACIIVGIVGYGQAVLDGFDKAPPTRGVERFTAHTLRSSELQLGVLFTQAYQDIYVEAGISNDVQIGLSLLTTMGGQPYGWVKMVNEIDDELQMGTSLRLRYRPGRPGCGIFCPPYRPPYLYATPGFCFSFLVDEDLSLHAGLQVRTRVNLDAPRIDYAHFSPYMIVDAGVADGFVLLGEASYNPTVIRVGLLMEVWEAFRIKASVSLPDLSAQFGADVRIRLRRED